ncbi:hypothetical protein [Poriferisphaera corsica]|nr:hypothetical protein [Poriferisphaera corsica]
MLKQRTSIIGLMCLCMLMVGCVRNEVVFEEDKQSPKSMSGYEAVQIANAFYQPMLFLPQEDMGFEPYDWDYDYLGVSVEADYIVDEGYWWVTYTPLPAAPDRFTIIQVNRDRTAEVFYPYRLPETLDTLGEEE